MEQSDPKEKLLSFSAQEQTEKLVASLREILGKQGVKEFVVEACGGLDSFACAALCLQVSQEERR